MITIVKPEIICEVGSGPLKLSKATRYANSGVNLWIFDPIKSFTDEIENFADNVGDSKIKVYNCAIYDYDGTVKIYDHLEASCIDGVIGPSFINEDMKLDYINAKANKGLIDVPCFKFSKFDNGRIDAIWIDVEGGEWFVLKHMMSRPFFISIETHQEGGGYINPFSSEINGWMLKNGYAQLRKTASDTHFIREDVAGLSKFGDIKLEI